MPVFIEKTADIAASTEDVHAIKDKPYATSQRPRTLQAVAAFTQQNTPAEDDITVAIVIDNVQWSIFRAGLARTTGAPIQAEDYIPCNIAVPPNVAVVIKAKNNDAAATHNAMLALMFDSL